MLKNILGLLLLVLIFACQPNPEEAAYTRPTVEPLAEPVKIMRLERQLFEAQSPDDIKSFLQKNRHFAQNFLMSGQYPSDSVLAAQMYAIIQNPGLDSMYLQAQKQFADLSHWENELSQAFATIKHYWPGFNVPKVVTTVSGLGAMGNEYALTDSLLVISLDYFLGPEASYRPSFPEYILERFAPEYVVPQAMVLLSTRFNKVNGADNTLLGDMIYYGKSYYFAKFLLPNTPDSLITGYTAEEQAGVAYNQERIWGHFLEEELLYTTKDEEKRRYLSERPKVPEIGDKAPGRVGYWLGWEIVKAYMREHENTNLKTLMENDNARKLLGEAKFVPKNRREE